MMAYLSYVPPRWLSLSCCALICACSSSEPEVVHNQPIPVSLNAAKNVNPYPDGQAAPIVTRVYQLAAKDRFMVADPMQLLQHDAQTLGDDEIGRDEFILQPGGDNHVTLPGNDKVHFVGIVAAYRAIDKDEWRKLVAVPDGHQQLTLDVTLGATGVQVKNDTKAAAR